MKIETIIFEVQNRRDITASLECETSHRGDYKTRWSIVEANTWQCNPHTILMIQMLEPIPPDRPGAGRGHMLVSQQESKMPAWQVV